MKAVDRSIVAIAVPAFATLIAEPLLLAADTAIVGHLGTVSLAAVAAAQGVITALYGACIFLAYGTTAAVSRHIGARDEPAALRLAMSGIWLGLGLGAVVGIAAAALAGPVLSGFSSSAEVADQARTYFWISCLGFPFMFALLAATGALRGLLDLRTPLVIVVVTNAVNVALSVFLVYGLDLGIGGAALGTVLAQGAGSGFLIATVVRRARSVAARLSPVPREILVAARDGVPLIVRSVTLQAVFLIATAVAATMGDAPLAGHRIAVTIVAVLAFSLDALAIAGQTLTGRYLGAGEVDVARRFALRLSVWGAGAGTVAALILLAARDTVPGLFTASEGVADVLVPALAVIALVQPLSGIVFALDGVLIGAGDARFLAIAGLIVLLAYIPLAIAVWLMGGQLAWLWAGYAGFIATRLVTLVLRARSSAWLVTGV